MVGAGRAVLGECVYVCVNPAGGLNQGDRGAGVGQNNDGPTIVFHLPTAGGDVDWHQNIYSPFEEGTRGARARPRSRVHRRLFCWVLLSSYAG